MGLRGVWVVNLRTPQVSLHMFAKGMADRELEILALPRVERQSPWEVAWSTWACVWEDTIDDELQWPCTRPRGTPRGVSDADSKAGGNQLYTRVYCRTRLTAPSHDRPAAAPFRRFQLPSPTVGKLEPAVVSLSQEKALPVRSRT